MKRRLLVFIPLLLTLSSCSLFEDDKPSSSKPSTFTMVCNSVNNHYIGGLTLSAQAASSKVVFDTINMEVTTLGFAQMMSGSTFRTQDRQGSYMLANLKDIVMVFNGSNIEEIENNLIMTLISKKNTYSFIYGSQNTKDSPYISEYKDDTNGNYTLYFSNYALKESFTKFSLEFTGSLMEYALIESISFTY